MAIMSVMDIRAVDLNLLKAFDALMTERAVTRAAGRIGLSQPAMSHALSRLRDLFADDLFVRSPGGMEPTARAREIAPLVSTAIDHIDAALNPGTSFESALSECIFTAGMAEYAEVPLVEHLAQAFSRTAPKATLRLVPTTGAEAPERLDRETVDVAVAHLGARLVDGLPQRFDSRILFRDPFVVVARRGHPHLAQPLSVEAYAGLGHVLVSPRGDTTGAVDRPLAALGLGRRIQLLVATYLALPAVLEATDLIATVPERTARRIAAAGFHISPLPIDLAVTVSMAWHRRNARAPAHLWFRSLLIDAAS
jgi:DNA-binding transcriptional LysR family regulator